MGLPAESAKVKIGSDRFRSVMTKAGSVGYGPLETFRWARVLFPPPFPTPIGCGHRSRRGSARLAKRDPLTGWKRILAQSSAAWPCEVRSPDATCSDSQGWLGPTGARRL